MARCSTLSRIRSVDLKSTPPVPPRLFSVPSLQQRISLMLGNKYLNQPTQLSELLRAMKDQMAIGMEARPLSVRRPA